MLDSLRRFVSLDAAEVRALDIEVTDPDQYVHYVNGAKAAFEKYGKVADAAVVNDRDTGRSRGFGFVEMASDDDARRAIEELDGAEVGGRNLKVNEARPRR